MNRNVQAVTIMKT